MKHTSLSLSSLSLVKILIVDDKESNLDTLEHILKSDSYEIHRAANGREALKLLLDHEYACCLLDVRMPEMDGFQVAEIIRNDPLLQYIPIIFVTAEMADKEAIFKGYEKGAVDYILKPVEPKIIRSKVNVFADGSFGFGQAKYEAAGIETKYNFTQFAISAGPAIFLTPATALEIGLGYTSSKVEDAEDRSNSFGVNIGFQIHLSGGAKK